MNSLTILLLSVVLKTLERVIKFILYCHFLVNSLEVKILPFKSEADLQNFINSHLCQGNEAYEMYSLPPSFTLGVSRAHGDRARAQGQGTAEVI